MGIPAGGKAPQDDIGPAYLLTVKSGLEDRQSRLWIW